MNSTPRSTPHWRAWLLLIFLAGLLIQTYMSIRSGMAGDQAHLLALGMRFVEGGPLEPFSKIMRGAGNNGALLQLLIGIPLAVVADHRAPLVVIALFDIAAFVLLTSALRGAIGDRAALVYLFLFWLSPWRLYHSSFLWEPQYLFLPAALHLFACWRARERRSFVSSLAIAASVVLAMQLHNSFLILALMTLALALRRAIHLHWPGVLVGGLLAGLPLILTIAAFVEGTLPPNAELEGFIGKGLVTVAPMLKGLVYWVRLGSLDVGNPLVQTVFIEEGIARHGAMTIVARIAQGIGIVTIIVATWASSWYLAPLWRRWRARRADPTSAGSFEPQRESGWLWLRRYAIAGLLSLVASAALSPITLQGWMVVIALHAAVIPVACWLDERMPDRRRTIIIAGIAAAQLLITLVVAHGNRIYSDRPLGTEHVRRYPELGPIVGHRSP